MIKVKQVCNKGIERGVEGHQESRRNFENNISETHYLDGSSEKVPGKE